VNRGHPTDGPRGWGPPERRADGATRPRGAGVALEDPEARPDAAEADQRELLKRLLRKLDSLAWSMEKANFAEYVALFEDPGRLIFYNFVAGMARGLGVAVGFLLLSALAIYALREAVGLNLPVIGRFLADLIRIIQAELRTTHGP
jgi:hypothetical protein